MAKLKKQKAKLKLKKVNKIKTAKPGKILSVKKKKAIIKSVSKISKKKPELKVKPKLKKIEKKVKVSKSKIVKKPKKKEVKKTVVNKKAKPVIKKTPKKVSNKSIVKNAGFAAESLFKAKIKVVGVGGGGGSIVSEIGRSLEKATFVIADTDIRALKKRSGIKYLWFGEELTHGLGTGVNVDLAKQAAESARGKISNFFKDQDIIIFVASLGGGLGSGATQIFAEAAREFGGITLGIFTMPFKFEGKNKQRIAQNALKVLRKSLNVSLVIPNEKIFKIIDESTPIINAFSTVNKSLIESLESLIDLIYNPGIINIDFADLRTILNGRGNSGFLNTVEESGKNNVEKICENIFKNPLLQTGTFKTEKILFNIAGGESLSMFQVEKISSHISDLNPKAKIIFGISKNPKLKNKIKTTILMTGAAPGSQVEEETVIKKEEVLKTSVALSPIVVPAKVESVKKNNAPVKKEAVVIRKEQKISAAPKIKKQKIIKVKKVENAVKKNQKPVFLTPVPPVLEPVASISRPKKMEIIDEEVANATLAKKTIRRSGLEIKKAEELQEEERAAQEKEWEIPAFLRKVKFKN